MTMIATGLNAAGQAHVAAELARLNLDWSLEGTCGDIENREGFMGLQPGQSYDYEISNHMAGKTSYGILGYIEIDADAHVRFEAIDG